MILNCIRRSDKARFQLEETRCQVGGSSDYVWRPTGVRAVQGHTGAMQRSMDLNEAMKRISGNQLPESAWHTTTRSAVDGISRNGLIPGGPSATGKLVHLSPLHPSDPNYCSGMSKSAPYLVEINPRLAEKLGCEFYKTESNAICCAQTVPATAVKCISIVETGFVLFL